MHREKVLKIMTKKKIKKYFSGEYLKKKMLKDCHKISKKLMKFSKNMIKLLASSSIKK